MGWRRDEIWFDVDDWLRGGDVQGGVIALPAPAFLEAAPEPEEVDLPNGLAASRQRRAELRRRRAARRIRAAALVIAPAAMLPFAAQRVGLGSGAGGALDKDPPSLVRDVNLLGSAAVEAPDPASSTSRARVQFPKIHWHRATSHGLPYSGWLSGGTQLPVEGEDYVTWNPVEDSVPNAPHRLYGHERTIRTVVSVLAAYREANPGAPRVVVGDVSFRRGGQMELHVSHQNGLDVDIYYPRIDRRLRAPRTTSQVDRKLAQDLVDRFVAAGAQIVFVGYSTGLDGPSEVVEPYPNHDDHMHVRFPPPRG